MSAETHCPLCGDNCVQAYHEDQRRQYLQCEQCALVFVPRGFHLNAAQERAQYDLHENEVNEPGYRRFLGRLFEPLTGRLRDGASGLDFGCGPAPALARMLEEAGFGVSLYDPFYFPDRSVLTARYDFICATEVVEHLRAPGAELEALWAQLVSGGTLAVMTKLVRDREAFTRWHYKNDPTHISFFSSSTWRWWAEKNGAALEIIGADVIMLQRS